MRLINELNNSTPNILYILTSERYTQLFGSLNYRFIIYQCSGSLKWGNKLGALPENHLITNNILPNTIPDIVLCFDKVKHYNICKSIADKYGTSLVLYEDTVYDEKSYDLLTNQQYSGVACSSKDHAALWGFKKYSVLPFAPLNNKPKCDHSIYVHASNDFSSTGTLIDKMNDGRCVIAPAIWENLRLINNGVNGYLYNINDPSSVQKIFNKLNNNKDLQEIVGLNAQETIKQKYNFNQFKTAFDNLVLEYK